MSRYWRPVAIAAVLLLAVSAIARADNPDGPVGSLMLEASLGLSSLRDYDFASFAYLRNDANDPIVVPLSQVQRVEMDAQRYGLALLAPIKPSVTLGGHFAVTNLDRSTRYSQGQVVENFNAWEVGFRVRYWWNLKSPN